MFNQYFLVVVFNMKKPFKIFSLSTYMILFILLFMQWLQADVIIYDGETDDTDLKAWASSTLKADQITNSNPHSGTNCLACTNTGAVGAWVVHQREYNRINIENISYMEIWVRGETGTESDFRIRLISRDTNDNFYYSSSGTMITPITDSWQKFTFSKNDLLSGADALFSLKQVIGIRIDQVAIGDKIYIDDVIVYETLGDLKFLDGDDAASSLRGGGEILVNAGDPTIFVTNCADIEGANCEKLSATAVDSKLLVKPIGSAIWDISKHESFSFYVKVINPSPSDTNFRIVLQDTSYKESKLIEIPKTTTNWTNFSFTIAELTNGRLFDPTQFLRIKFHWPWGSATYLIDDMRFNAPASAPNTPAFIPGSCFAVSTNEIKLEWNDLNNETVYTLFRNVDNNTNTITDKFQIASDQTATNDTGLAKGTWYYYWLKAYNAMGASVFSDVISNQTYTNISQIKPEIKNAYVDPSSIYNNKPNVVVFNVIASSSTTNIISAAVDLSSIGSGKAEMTNISGATLWRYAYIVPAGIAEGKKTIPVSIEDGFNNIVSGKIILNIKFAVSYTNIAGSVQVQPNYFKVSEEENDLKIIVPISENQSRLKIRIFNIARELVRNLEDAVYDKDIHEITWDLLDDNNNECESGVYIVSVIINNEKPIMKKVILIK